MRTTVVPAQVTTVEDRIAGNFTFTQIILLIIPLFIGTAFYLVIPPHSGISIFKLVLIMLQFMFFGSMAIRIRGKLVIDWLVILLRYALRPRIYIFTKADRTDDSVKFIEDKKVANEEQIKEEAIQVPGLSLREQTTIGELVGNPSLSLRFVAKKGGVDVSLASTED